MNTVKAVGVEKKNAGDFLKLAKGAFLGRALVNISEVNTRIAVKFGTFNPGRKVQTELLRAMVGRMTLGDCTSESSPLIIAIDPSKVSLETLAVDGPDRNAEFAAGGTVALELLAGMHRVKAARLVSKHLRSQLAKIERRFGDDSLSDDLDEDSGDHELTRAIEQQVARLKEVVEKVESWPVMFYDIGEHLPPTVGNDANVTQVKLRELGRSISLKDGNPDVLLHALAKNTEDKNAPKTVSEVFSDILIRHLYSPGPATSWDHLITSRTLQVICYRGPTWNLATTAILASPDIHNSWVVQSDALRHVAEGPSSKV